MYWRGHNCFGAVLYPITMADFVIADVTDAMMGGLTQVGNLLACMLARPSHTEVTSPVSRTHTRQKLVKLVMRCTKASAIEQCGRECHCSSCQHAFQHI
jgi:hypothetical protein